MTKTTSEHIGYWFAPIEELYKKLANNQLGSGPEARFFWDNGGKVLLVAHVDTVVYPYIAGKRKNLLYGAGFDDRAGCWLAYNLGREYGYDVLLCDYEESGRSSGQKHNIKQDYQCIVELDREGEDFVDYGLADDDLIKALEKHGFRHSYGSFTDICALITDVACVNIGIGVKHSHSCDSYMDLDVMARQVSRLREFFDELAKSGICYKQPEQPKRYFGFSGYGEFDDNDENYFCDFCGNIAVITDELTEYYYCQDCYDYECRYKDEPYYLEKE